MNPTRLIFKNVAGNGARSLLVVLCIALTAGFALTGAFVVRGAETGVRAGLQRLGADIVVVPETAEDAFASALITRSTAEGDRLPADTLARVASVEGVAATSPQLAVGHVSLASPRGRATASLVAIDPATDFTVRPWLAGGKAPALAVGEAVLGGDLGDAAAPPANITVAGRPLAVVGVLEPTGTAMDRTLFVSFATLETMRGALELANPPLLVPANAYSAILVRARPDSDFRLLAPGILSAVPGVLPVESPAMYRALHVQLAGIARGATVVLALCWALSAAVVATVFTLAARERRQEIAVLRALGATRRFVVGSLLAEASALAALGGVLGALLAGGVTSALGDAIARTLGLPVVFPGAGEWAQLVALALVSAWLTGPLAAIVPALRASGSEPAAAARE